MLIFDEIFLVLLFAAACVALYRGLVWFETTMDD